MSRYHLSSINYPEVVVGWDPGLDTFFCHIWADTNEVADRREVLWIGSTFQEITTLGELILKLSNYCQIPEEVQTRLMQDQERQPHVERVGLLAALAQASRAH